MPMQLSEVNPIAFWMHGQPTEGRTFHVAILSEGFLPERMHLFREHAEIAASNFLGMLPFSRYFDRIGIIRIECTSKGDSRSLIPLRPPPASFRDQTPFDAFFDEEIEREIFGNEDAVRTVIASLQPGLPRIDGAAVIVDHPAFAAAAGGGVAWMAIGSLSTSTFAHELGHSAFGLADEYEYLTGRANEPVHSYPSGRIPAQPNITTRTDRQDIPWHDLITPAEGFSGPVPDLPWTVPNRSNPNGAGTICTLNKVKKPEVPDGAVGLFEGGLYNSCNIYRPSLSCCMRDMTEFCPVCSQVIDRALAAARLDARPQISIAEERWTHVLTLGTYASVVGGSFHIAACYETSTGRFRLTHLDPLIQGLAVQRLGTAVVPSGYSTLAILNHGRDKYLFMGNLANNRRALYRVNADATSALDASLELQYDTQPTPLVGYSHVAAFQLDGHRYLLHYGRVTGELELEEIVFDAGVPFARTVASSRAGSLAPWRPFLSGLTVLDIDGAPYLVGLDATARTLTLASIRYPVSGSAATMLLETYTHGPEFVHGFQTHCTTLALRGTEHLCLYSALDGQMRLYKPRAGGAGVDFEFAASTTPGATAIYDVGLPAMGAMTKNRNGGGRSLDYLWLYNAALCRYKLISLY